MIENHKYFDLKIHLTLYDVWSELLSILNLKQFENMNNLDQQFVENFINNLIGIHWR